MFANLVNTRVAEIAKYQTHRRLNHLSVKSVKIEKERGKRCLSYQTVLDNLPC